MKLRCHPWRYTCSGIDSFGGSYIVDAPPAVCWQYFVEPGNDTVTCRSSRRESSSSRTARVGSQRERRATVLTASAATVSGTISDWRPYEYFTCHLSRVEAEGVEHAFVEGLETYEFIDLGDGRTEHRWLLRADDRTPQGLRAFEESLAFLKRSRPTPHGAIRCAAPSPKTRLCTGSTVRRADLPATSARRARRCGESLQY